MQTRAQIHKTLWRIDCCHQWLCTIQNFFRLQPYRPGSFFFQIHSVCQKTFLNKSSCTERWWAHTFLRIFLHFDKDCSCSSHLRIWRHHMRSHCVSEKLIDIEIEMRWEICRSLEPKLFMGTHNKKMWWVIVEFSSRDIIDKAGNLLRFKIFK